MKARSGGSGLKPLEPLVCPPSGYDVQSLKDEAKAAIIYIVPLNKDLDTSPLTVNDISAGVEVATTKCINCSEVVALIDFKQHRSTCGIEETICGELIFIDFLNLFMFDFVLCLI